MNMVAVVIILIVAALIISFLGFGVKLIDVFISIIGKGIEFFFEGIGKIILIIFLLVAIASIFL